MHSVGVHRTVAAHQSRIAPHCVRGTRARSCDSSRGRATRTMNDKNREADATQADARPSTPLHHAAALSIIIGIMLAMFLSALEQTIVAPALPTIGRTLGGVENLPW